MDYALLPIYNTVPGMDAVIGNVPDILPDFTTHFSQSEDFFLKLDSTVTIPSLPIHHTISETTPSQTLRDALMQTVQSIAGDVPGIFYGMRYFFQPSEPLKPSFYRIYRHNSVEFLYLLRLDLRFRPQFHSLARRGTNDNSPEYATSALFLEADIVPLRELQTTDHGEAAIIRRSISDTWVGETGRGYFVQGIWIDQDLTKFFSKLFLPEKSRLYPFFPFTCKYQAITQTIIDFSHTARQYQLENSQKALQFLEGHIAEIQSVLRHKSFSEELDLFQKLRSHIPREWTTTWEGVRITPYLNENNQKEFIVYNESNQ